MEAKRTKQGYHKLTDAEAIAMARILRRAAEEWRQAEQQEKADDHGKAERQRRQDG